MLTGDEYEMLWEHVAQRDDAAQGAQDEGCGKMTFQKKKSPFPFVEEGITPNDHPPSCVFLCAHMDMSMDTHMDTSIDIHMDMSMDIHMEMPIKSKVSKLDGSCT